MSTLTPLAGRPDAPAPAARTRPSGARPADLVWVTWRQHRPTIVSALVLTAAISGAMLYLASRYSAIYQQCGNTQCSDSSSQAATLAGSFGYNQLQTYLTVAVMFLPLLGGIFLGIPLLAREHEQRTLLLAWSQDITKQRWLWTKFALLAAVVAVYGAAVSAAAAHLADEASLVTGQSLFFGSSFLVTGWVPLVESVVWFAVGVALGAAFRRTLPAVFAALVLYIGAYFTVQAVYPTFVTPLQTLAPVGTGGSLGSNLGSNILVINRDSGTGGLYDASGHPVSMGTAQSLCSGVDSKFMNGGCLSAHHFQVMLAYQPASRISEFHEILNGYYLGVGVIAVAVVWWLVRRTSMSAG